jgi:hypothetical protein
VIAIAAAVQVEGADFRFQERMRGVVEYMQFREMPAEIKRKASSEWKAPLAKGLEPVSYFGQSQSNRLERRAFLHASIDSQAQDGFVLSALG